MVIELDHAGAGKARSNSGPTVARTWRVAWSSSNRNPDRGPPPLDAGALERLALRYVERYATTQAKLERYLARKLHERGWTADEVGIGDAGGADAALAALVARTVALGYVDDAAFAETRVAALARRGYGARRRRDALRAAGVGTAAAAQGEAEAADADGWPSALAFARRRRIGPYADAPADADTRRRQLGAMLRAGHAPRVANALVQALPGEWPEGAPDADA